MQIRTLVMSLILISSAALLITYNRSSSARVWSGEADRPLAGKTNLAELQWQTVVNNSFTIPDGTTNFSSYSQPAVNSQGMIVFRARSTGGHRETGIFVRKGMSGKVIGIADLNTLVPYPNNLNAKFLEFSAIPRIAANSDHTAFVGLHKPAYRFTLPDGSETRAGTAGIYMQIENGLLVTGASKLGMAPDFEYFAVPGTKRTPFDIFPGAPAVTDDGTIVFKGNYQIDGVGKTGIFYRSLLNSPGGGTEPIDMIANTDMAIPGPPSMRYKEVKFGSTAPPSVFGDKVVFLGLDNEDDPHFGGIFISEIKSEAPLTKLVSIGEEPPNMDFKMPPLTRIGEGLSFDGRFIAFWAAWGEETKTIRLFCPTDANPDIQVYCAGVDPLSRYDDDYDRWYQDKEVPVNQGIFFYDLITKKTFLASKTPADFADFIFWGYSGRVPGSGAETDAEPPRWRSATFLTISEGELVFKARTGYLGKHNEYFDPIDGLYLANPLAGKPLEAVAVMGMDGALFDQHLTPGTMPVTGVGVEREGFRGNKLVITLAMANEEEGWGGVYITTVRGPQQPTQLVPKNEKRSVPNLKKAVAR